MVEKTQRQKIIDYIKGMTDERLYEVFNCQADKKDSVFDCPYWIRQAKCCFNPGVCHKIPYEQEWERKEREAEKQVVQENLFNRE